MKDLTDFVTASTSVVDLLKSAYKALPDGAQREEIEQKTHMAEELLKRSDAKLAKDLGFKICDCQWPPIPMLWNQLELEWICQNEKCGRFIKNEERDIRPTVNRGESRLTRARRGY